MELNLDALKTAKVLDGDTLELPDGTRIRLQGGDTPETGGLKDHGDGSGRAQQAEPGAETATDFLRSELQNVDNVQDLGTDATGERTLGRLEVDGESVGTRAIRSGVAMPMQRFTGEEADQAYKTSRANRLAGNKTPTDRAFDEEVQANPQPLDVRTTLDWSMEGEGAFERALERGWANTKATVGASAEFLGGKLGSETLEDWGRDYTARKLTEAALNPAEVESFEDVESLSELGTYTTEILGENLPTVATMATGAGAGASIAAGIGKAALKKAATAQAKKQLTKLGAGVGAVGATYPQHLGEGFMELQQSGVEPEDTNAPFFTAAINTALDVGPMGRLASVAFGGLDAKMAKDLTRQAADTLDKKGVLNRVAGVGKTAAKQGVIQAPLEGITETTQEVVNMTARAYHDPRFSFDDPQVESRLKEAFAAGSIVGGTLGAGGGAVQGVRRETQEWLKAKAPAPLDETTAEEPATPLEGEDSAGQQEADQSSVVPDQPEDVQAQVEAMQDPESSRDSVLVGPGEQMPLDLDATTPDGQKLRKVDLGEQGALITANQDKFERVREAEQQDAVTEPLLNEVLFNSGGAPSKEQGNRAASAFDTQGRVVADIAFDANDEQGRLAALREAQRQVPRGTVQERDPATVISDRQSSVRDRSREGAQGSPTASQSTGRRAQGSMDMEEDASVAEFLARGREGGSFVQSGEGLPVNFERRRPQETKNQKGVNQESFKKAKSNINRFLTVMQQGDPENGIDGVVPEDVRRDEDGIDKSVAEGNFGFDPAVSDGETTTAQALLPNEQFRDPDTDAGVVQALTRAAAAGGESRRNTMELKTPSGSNVRFNVPELVAAGATLDGRSLSQLTSSGRVDAVNTSLSYLLSRGFRLKEGQEQPTSGTLVDTRRNREQSFKQARRSQEKRGTRPEQEREPDTPIAFEQAVGGSDFLTKFRAGQERVDPDERSEQEKQEEVEDFGQEQEPGDDGQMNFDTEARQNRASRDDAAGQPSVRRPEEENRDLGPDNLPRYQINSKGRRETPQRVQTRERSGEGVQGREPLVDAEGGVVEGSATSRRQAESAPENTTLDLDTLRQARERLRERNERNNTGTVDERQKPLEPVQALVDEWARQLNLPVQPTIEMAEPRDALGRYHPDRNSISVPVELGQILNEQGSSEVDDTATTMALEVVAHEFGHFVHHQSYRDAPAAIKERIDAEYQAFRERAEQFPETDSGSRRAERSVGANREAFIAGRGNRARNKDASYDVHFNEWFADQVARVLLNEETTVETPSVRRFFEQVADQIRRVYDQIRNTAGFAPASSMQEFVDNLRKQAANRVEQQEQVNQEALQRLQDEASAINSILESIGFKGMANLADDAGIDAERARQRDAIDPENGDPDVNAMAQRNVELLDQLKTDAPVARVVFLRDPEGGATPLIYMSNQFRTNRARHRALLHETGHVALRQFMSNATPQQRQAMIEAFGGGVDYTTFEENFANGFLAWANSKAQFAQLEGTVDNEIRGTIRSAFKSLWDSLRKLWRRFDRQYPVDQTFADFMESIVNRKRRQRGQREVQAQTDLGQRMARMLDEEGFTGGGFIRPDLFPSEYLDLSLPGSLDSPNGARSRKARKVLENAKGATQASKALLAEFHDKWTRPLHAVWRRMGYDDMADHVHRRAGRGDSLVRRGTMFAEQRGVLGQWEGRLHALGKQHLSNPWKYVPGIGRPQPSAELDQASRDMLAGREPTTEVGREMHSLFREQYDWLRKQGVRVPFRKNYTPVAPNLDVLNRHGAERVFKERVQEWAAREENQQWWQEKYGEELTSDEAKRFADYLYHTFTSGEAAMDQQGSNAEASTEWDFSSPGFQNRKQRKVPQSLWDDLSRPFEDVDGNVHEHGFREHDMLQLLNTYMKSAVKRGVSERRFGLGSEMGREVQGLGQNDPTVIDEIDQRFEHAHEVQGRGEDHPDWDSLKISANQRLQEDRSFARTIARRIASQGGTRQASEREIAEAESRLRENPDFTPPSAVRAEAWAQAKEFRDRKVKAFNDEWGVDPYDPSAGLKIRLANDARKGQISPEDHERIVNELVPSMHGTLNADMSIMGKPRPWARRGQAAMLLYQNTRILALAPLAQMIDFSLIAARTPGMDNRLQLAQDTIRGIVSKQSRDELMRVGELVGAVQNDMTEHYLNDEAGAMMASRKMQQFSEGFFRVTGMHWMTNFQRALATNTGLRLIEQFANEGNAEELGKLNITLEEARSWVADGKPKEWNEKHAAVMAGLHQFIDEGSLRPTPGMRPKVGNDHRLSLLWHLNTFMYAYQQQVLNRVWEDSKRQYGQEEGARKMGAVLPMLTLAAFSMPLAALGMELRWLIDPPLDQNRPQSGWEYTWASIERSGMLGLAQVLTGMHRAESFGNFGLLAPLGPTAGQLQSVGKNGFSEIVREGYPFQQYVNGLGSQWADGP